MPLSVWERWRLAGQYTSNPVQLAGETPALPGSDVALCGFPQLKLASQNIFRLIDSHEQQFQKHQTSGWDFNGQRFRLADHESRGGRADEFWHHQRSACHLR